MLKKMTTILLAVLITSLAFVGCSIDNKKEARAEEKNTIGIIGAMNEELEVLLKDMKNKKEVKKNDLTFYEGDLWGQHVVAVVSGVGKVNAASCTQILASEFKVNSIINIGVAGGVSKDIYPGDVVIGDTYVQHDMDTTVFGDKVGQVPRMAVYDFKADENLLNLAKEAAKTVPDINTYVGRIVSGDQFIADSGKVQWLEKEFNAKAVEMESAAIAQVAYLNNIPFVIIRSISDNANNGAHMDYEEFIPIGVKNSTSILKAMFEKM
ncbi:5'-methylthioadenosine/adenosylhomocysteine nucleosidase [Clostridium sp. B9]|uniref:5'-methylthioadenosine/adenosylhomocysteine nucleosidase n=1 Tax=Clostridium sp. B9 TaxID=3423224 RepID=UPI003D2F1863